LRPGEFAAVRQDGLLENVSDTGLIAAACRAIETKRPDGLIDDPFAERLAGERGMSLSTEIPVLDWMCVAISLRARIADRMVERILSGGFVKTVLNIGAGLDSRAWRLDVGRTIRWHEIDLPPVIRYKRASLAPFQPRCDLVWTEGDVASAEDRGNMFASAGNDTLVITEGLLRYLDLRTLEALARQAAAARCRLWLLDITGERRQTGAGKMSRGASIAGPEIVEVLAANGWRLAERETYAQNAHLVRSGRLTRKEGDAATSLDLIEPVEPVGGIYLFEPEQERSV
jgi:methyltransferase (TIGR00027 family)